MAQPVEIAQPVDMTAPLEIAQPTASNRHSARSREAQSQNPARTLSARLNAFHANPEHNLRFMSLRNRLHRGFALPKRLHHNASILPRYAANDDCCTRKTGTSGILAL